MPVKQQSAGGLITETVSTLTGGVSQQADAMRQPTQAKEIFNCLLSPTEGLKKRPPSQIVQNLWPVFEDHISLAPYTRTTTEASITEGQTTVLTFGLEDAGTKFTIRIDYYASIFPTTYQAFYTVQEGALDLATVAAGIAAAITEVAGGVITATATMDDTVELTGVAVNQAFNVLFQRSSTEANVVISAAALFTHVYNRDINEKYLLCVANGKLTVVDLLARDFPTVTVVDDANDYLVTTTPGLSIRALTVGDYTFIINREITVASTAGSESAVRDPEALLWVRMGNYGTKYVVTVNGTEYSWYADKSLQRQIDTTVIARAIGCKLPAGRYVSKLVLTGTFVVGETITVTNVAPFGVFDDAYIVYTVKASESDPTSVESTHEIAVGVAELWNFLSRDASAGSVVAVPVDYDENLALTDNAVLFYGPSLQFGVTNDVAIETTMTTSDTSVSGTATMTALDPQEETFEVEQNGSTLRIRQYAADIADYEAPTFDDFTISTSDGLGDQSARAIKGEVQAIEDLPARAVDGFMVKVTGDESTDKDDFYVQYTDTGSVDKDGVWKETLKGGELTALDPTTMPHTLVRASDGTFTFSAATWTDRLVGDLTTAPFPSFTGFTLDDVMFHKNRLGFVSGQNTVYSQVGKYFNFFRVSIQQLLDEDIIDYAIAATEIAPIRHVVPMQNKVTLWSDREQFVQAGEPLFTAKTVFANRVTGFECSHRVKPILIGKDIFFCTDRNSATKIMEFYSTDSGTANDAEDNTQIVPSYLKGKPLAVCGSENASMLFVATLTNTNDLYVYNYLWNGQQLLQAAWSTWRFQDGNILAVNFLENTLLLVIQRGPIVMLEKIEILPADTDNQPQDTPSDHLVHLDLRFGTEDFTWFDVTVAYDAMTHRTTWTFASDPTAAVPHNPLYPMKVVKKATPTDPSTDELPDIQRPNAGAISAAGDWHATDVWIGLQYDMEYEFSRLYPREQSEDGRMKAITDGQTKVRDLKLDYKGGYFTVEVTPSGRSTPYVYEFDGDTEIEEGTLKVPVLMQNDQVRILLKNSSHRPSTITGMEWDGMFQRRTGR